MRAIKIFSYATDQTSIWSNQLASFQRKFSSNLLSYEDHFPEVIWAISRRDVGLSVRCFLEYFEDLGKFYIQNNPLTHSSWRCMALWKVTLALSYTSFRVASGSILSRSGMIGAETYNVCSRTSFTRRLKLGYGALMSPWTLTQEAGINKGAESLFLSAFKIIRWVKRRASCLCCANST